jgi:membrane-associated PAP2 superfamily phosphatase
MSSFDQYAMTHDWIITQFFTGLVSQGIWFLAGFFFYDAKTRKERVCIFIGTALGCGVGSTLMLRWFKPLFNSFF